MNGFQRPALARLDAGALALADPRAGADWVAWANERAARVLDLEIDVALWNGDAVDRAVGAPRMGAGMPAPAARSRRDRGDWKPYAICDGVAVVPVWGLLVKELGWIVSSWATGYAELQWQIEEALEDAEVRGVALLIDSPGGFVSGLLDFGRWLREEARGRKPLVAIVDGDACSAAYWIAAQTESISIVADGCAGSIGVYAVHWSFAKALVETGASPTIIRAGAHKARGLPLEELAEEVRAEWQAEIDEHRQVFAEEVAPEEAAAFARGAAAERERIGSILSAEHVNRDNLPAAIELALNTEVEPAAAAAVLGATGASIGGLAAAMAGENPDIGPAGGARSGGPNTAELMAARFAKK